MPIIGTVTVIAGGDSEELRGYRVRILCIQKDALRSPRAVSYLKSDEEIAAAGGVTRFDRVVAALLMEGDRELECTLDPRAMDLECFAHLGAVADAPSATDQGTEGEHGTPGSPADALPVASRW